MSKGVTLLAQLNHVCICKARGIVSMKTMHRIVRLVIIFGIICFIMGLIVLTLLLERKKKVLPTSRSPLVSLCGKSATRAGLGQKVISYSLFLPAGMQPIESKNDYVVLDAYFPRYATDNQIRNRSQGNDRKVLREYLYERYLEPFFDLILEAEKLYPGWRIRLYTNIIGKDKILSSKLLEGTRAYDWVDICNMNKFPMLTLAKEIHSEKKTETLYNHLQDSDLGRRLLTRNVSKAIRYGMFWRFLPMGDPTVSRFLSRDLDALILGREVSAVNEWIESGREFHVMRDAVSHKFKMLGGLWGGFNEPDRDYNRGLLNQLLAYMLSTKMGEDSFEGGREYGADQIALKSIIWPSILFYGRVLVHDSYRCNLYGFGGVHVRPFPTQRPKQRIWVGFGPGREGLISKNVPGCPYACRPKEHQNWSYC